MSKKDKVKEKIVGLRFWLGIAVATLLAIVGWVVTNFDKVNSWLVYLSLVTAACLCVGIIFVMKRIDKHIDKLEDL